MSGICSAHMNQDPNCSICMAIPLTDEDKAYYQGWDDALQGLEDNGWYSVENCVLDAFEALEEAVRSEYVGLAAGKALDELDKLRALKRGFAPTKEERYKEK